MTYIILVASHYSKSSHSKTRTQVNYPCGSFKHTVKQNILLKQERIWTTTDRKEAFRATTLRPKFGTFHDESSPFGK